MSEDTGKQLCVYLTELYQAATALTVAINALYEQQRVRTWEQGLGMPATEWVPGGTKPVEGAKSAETAAVAKPDLYAPVKAAILAYSAKHGQKAAQDILARFNVKSGLQLKEGQYRQAIEAFKL